MASGRPIIGSDIGGIPDLIIDGETGFIVKPGNIDQIAERIIQIISNKKLAIIMGKKARENCIAKYDYEEHYKKLVKIYEKVQEANKNDA
jgi:glycosyltransferase involved in cell wall biosynthesis